MTESQSTGSGGYSSVLCPDGLPAYRGILRPHNAVILSSPFIDPYIPTGYEPGLNALLIRCLSIIVPTIPAALRLASASHPCTLVF